MTTVGQADRRPPGLPTQETIAAIHDYLVSQQPLSIGDGGGIIADLEHRLSEVLGVPNVLTCSSGTAALHSAYLALDLPAGSEVIAPVTTFHASITPALHCGLTPVLVDVDPATGNMCPKALAEAITERTSCVVVTHNLGHPVALTEILEICRRHRLRLVEDCSHAYLSTYHGNPVGTFGDVAVWSMQANKTLSAGEGGFLATPHRDLYERACLAGHYRGRSQAQIADPHLRRFAETGLGLKYRLHPLAAVIAHAEVAHLAERVTARQRLLTHLSEQIGRIPGVRAPVVEPGVTMGGWFSYRPSLTPEADLATWLPELARRGVPAHRPSIASLDSMPLFQDEVPLRAAAGTWRPRLVRPFTGARAYEHNRISITVGPDDDRSLMDEYGAAIRQVAGITAPASPR